MDITVTKQSNDVFGVRVQEGSSETSHTVTVDDAYYQRLTGRTITKEELVEKSFRFLLDREPKESVLAKFELPVINRYFPEYEQTIRSM